MTKRVQIKNADNNESYKVFVHHQDQTPDGWKTVHVHEVQNEETFETYIHSGRRVVISESSEA